jgi:hypothetical protein
LKYLYKIFLSVIALAIMIACSEPEQPKVEVKPRVFPEYHIALDEIIKTKGGVIRGINLNNNADSIKKPKPQRLLKPKRIICISNILLIV